MRDSTKLKLAAAYLATCLTAVLMVFPSAAVAQSAPAAGAKAPAAVTGGFVKSVSGSVSLSRGTAREVAAKPGDVFGSRTSIRTGPDGDAVLLFADGQNIRLGKSTNVRIDAYQFDPANVRASRASIVLVSGTMSVVTGAIQAQNPAGLQISVGTAVITILSKDVAAFVVDLPPGQAVQAFAAVTIGEISLQTTSGLVPRIGADQFVRWQNGVTPTPVLPLAAAPAVLQALIVASQATVKESNLPIDIESASAQAALSILQGTAQGTSGTVSEAAVSGQLNMVSGNVFIRDQTGKEVPAKIGDVFGPGSSIRTGNNGQVGLLFAEGQYAALGEDSMFRVAGNQIDPQLIGAGPAPFGLVTGKMSFVAFAVSADKQAGLKIGAGNSLVSVVGAGVAAFVVDVRNAQGDGSAAVTAGEISLQTSVGPPIRISADRFTTWQLGVAPAPVRPLSEASATLKLAFTDTVGAPTNAGVAEELATLPATGAGPATVPASPTAAPTTNQQAQAEPVAIPAIILPAVAPGGGGSCTGSPC